MSSEISDPNSMQIFATSATQKLLFDYSNSQSFYLYTIATKQLSSVSAKAAKTFYDAAPNQSAGVTSWGYTPTEGMKLNNSN